MAPEWRSRAAAVGQLAATSAQPQVTAGDEDGLSSKAPSSVAAPPSSHMSDVHSVHTVGRIGACESQW